jgi:acyl carrier protein
MTRAATEQAVREILQELTLSGECLRAPSELRLETIGVDSVAMIELVFALEDRFAIQIHEDEVAPEHFSSIESLTSLVARKCL